MPISAKWKHKSSIHIGFIVFNGGVTIFFAKSVFVTIKLVCRAIRNCIMEIFILFLLFAAADILKMVW